MANNILTRYESNDGIELVINQNTGEAFATINGYSRMSGLNKSTISRRVNKGVASEIIIKAEILTPGGLQGVALVPADIVFDWMFDDNPTLARAMGKAGATLYMQHLAGFKAEPVKPEPPKIYSAMEKALAVNSLAASLQMFEIEIKNPRFLQHAQDLVGDMLGFTPRPERALESSQPSETWLGVAERAEQLGYSISLVTKHRSQLGKYVKASGLNFKEEKRLCNGTQRPIKVYKLDGSLDTAIKEFMDAKTLAQ